jgi:hypothetical protein
LRTTFLPTLVAFVRLLTFTTVTAASDRPRRYINDPGTKIPAAAIGIE